jgi:hypothetical protein
VLGVLFALSALVAVLVPAGLGWALVAGGVTLALVVALLGSLTTAIAVTADAVVVGRARLEPPYVGKAVALDADQTRRRTGPDADARAYLVLRPYLRTAVEIAVDDGDDPAPYWLVSTRRPQALAAAVLAARSPTLTR